MIISPRQRLPRVQARRLLCLLILALGAPVVVHAAGSDELGRAVAGFYDLYLKIRPLGVPEEEALVKLQPHLSMPLQQRLRSALRAEQQYHKRTRGEAPPLIEGDLFSSLFEGATAFQVLACEAAGASGSCTVELSSLDPRDRSTFKWKDKVHAIREARRWVLDDIEYLGDWPFMHKGRLTGVLKQIIAQGGEK